MKIKYPQERTFFNFLKNNSRPSLIFLTLLVAPLMGYAQYAFKKEKEFRIESLYPVELVDYHPGEGLYLGYVEMISKGVEVVLVDEEGEVVIQKRLAGEGPEQYTASLNCLAFSNEGEVLLQTPFEVLRYDRDLKLKERIRFQASLQMYLSGNLRQFAYFFKDTSPSVFSFFTIPTGASRYLGPGDFRASNLLEIYDLGEKKSYEILPVADRPLYRNFDKSVGVLYFPVYTVDRDQSRLYVTASLDNEITVVDLNTNETLSRIPINHGEFGGLKSSVISLESLPSYKHITLAGKNHRMYKLDNGLIALEYIREIPFGTYEKRIADDPRYHHFQDPNYHRLILFDEKKQISSDLLVPANGKIKTSLPGNRFLVKIENPEVEEDFIRYGIFGLSR
jgi:hypothetical protein